MHRENVSTCQHFEIRTLLAKGKLNVADMLSRAFRCCGRHVANLASRLPTCLAIQDMDMPALPSPICLQNVHSHKRGVHQAYPH